MGKKPMPDEGALANPRRIMRDCLQQPGQTPMTTTLKAADLIESVAAALQYISFSK
jgi:hypothetical protein